ncbi:MAG: Gfo/Idh/MocA family oxidoreductase [Pseudomonadota bacterium]
MTAALIGTGMVADMHVSAVAEAAGVRLKGAFSRGLERCSAFAERHRLHRYESVEAIAEDAEVDFILLATPPDARAAYVERMIAVRKPILMEKPVERDTARARALVHAAEAADLPLGVLLQHRMRPAAQALSARIQAGALGRIATVEVRVPWWRPQSYYDAPGRGTYARDGGGVLITQAIHTIDLMLQFCGPVRDVQAMVATSDLHRLQAEDFAAAALRFESGATGALMASTTHYPGGREAITLNGTEGSATLTANHLTVHSQSGEVEDLGAAAGTGGGADPMAFSADWHRAVIEDFAAALRDRRPPLITGRSALAAQALIDAILASARAGSSLEPEAV